MAVDLAALRLRVLIPSYGFPVSRDNLSAPGLGVQAFVDNTFLALTRLDAEFVHHHFEYPSSNRLQGLADRAWRWATGYRRYRLSSPAPLLDVGRRIDAVVDQIAPDAILTLEDPRLFYGAASNVAKFAYTDGPIAEMIGKYSHMIGLPECDKAEVSRIERQSIRVLRRLFVPTRWAANAFRSRYEDDCPPVDVVSIGAGFDATFLPSFDSIRSSIGERSRQKTTNFVFIGVDWVRKGGGRAVNFVKALRDRGHDVTLTLVGTTSPEPLPHYIREEGRIDKSTDKGKARFHELMLQSHFLIVPTLADFSPHVFVEAKAFGAVPIGTKVGGVPDVLGESGLLLEEGAVEGRGEDFDRLVRLLEDRHQWEAQARRALAEYRQDHSWDQIAARIFSAMQADLASRELSSSDGGHSPAA